MTEMETAAPIATGNRDRRSAWAGHLAALGALIVLLGVLNLDAIAAALRVWWISPTFSHCFLILPISAFLIWRHRRILAAMTPAVYPPALFLALPLVLMLLLGALVSINEVQQLALIGLVQVLTLAILGPRIYRDILFPLLFLFFLVPMGEYLIGPLQRFTTLFISAGLSLLGILHHTEFTTIDLVNGRFQVAEACAGLRFLIATIAIGVLFTYMTYSKWYKIALYVFASIVVPVIGNGFRALGIVLLAHWSDNKIATGADHIVYGWGFSVLILCLLMFVGVRFADPVSSDKTVRISPARPSVRAHGFAITLATALVMVCAVPAFLYWNSHRFIAFNKAALAVPPLPASWSVTHPSGQWAPSFATPNAQMNFALRDAVPFSPVVDVFLNYYVRGHEDHSLISSTNKLWDENVWHPLLQDSVVAHFGGHRVIFGQLEIASQGRARLAWWTYWVNGRFTTSGMTVKLDGLRNVLAGPEGSALLVVSTPVEGDVESARTRLRGAVTALVGLPRRLEAAADLPGTH